MSIAKNKESRSVVTKEAATTRQVEIPIPQGEVFEVACMSTLHVSEETMRALDENSIEDIISHPFPEGAWVFVADESDESTWTEIERSAPKDLDCILLFARRLGVSWVKLDRDGAAWPDLPTYDW